MMASSFSHPSPPISSRSHTEASLRSVSLPLPRAPRDARSPWPTSGLQRRSLRRTTSPAPRPHLPPGWIPCAVSALPCCLDDYRGQGCNFWRTWLRNMCREGDDSCRVIMLLLPCLSV